MRTCLTRERRERRREKSSFLATLRNVTAAHVKAMTPGSSADMEAVKKFSRSSVSIAFICRSSSRFMYCVWMSSNCSSGPCTMLYAGDAIC